MQLKDIMAKKVITITGTESVADAAKLMRENKIGCLVITNAGSVRGIITDRDMAVTCLSEAHSPANCRVSNHMTNPVITA